MNENETLDQRGGSMLNLNLKCAHTWTWTESTQKWKSEKMDTWTSICVENPFQKFILTISPFFSFVLYRSLGKVSENEIGKLEESVWNWKVGSWNGLRWNWEMDKTRQWLLLVLRERRKVWSFGSRIAFPLFSLSSGNTFTPTAAESKKVSLWKSS